MRSPSTGRDGDALARLLAPGPAARLATHLSGMLLVLGAAACGASQTKPPPETASAPQAYQEPDASMPVASTRAAPAATSGYALPDASCEGSVAIYRARAVVTVNGADTASALDILVQGPAASAKSVCERALASNPNSGGVGQRVVVACTQSELGAASGSGWSLVTPVVLSGVALKMRIGWPGTGPSMDPCTRGAWLHLTSFPSEQACRTHVQTVASAREQSERTSRQILRDVLTVEVDKAAATETAACAKVPHENACDAARAVARQVATVCEAPAGQACSRAKEAEVLLAACEDRLERLGQDCATARVLVGLLREQRDAPKEASDEPQSFCQAAGL